MVASTKRSKTTRGGIRSHTVRGATWAKGTGVSDLLGQLQDNRVVTRDPATLRYLRLLERAHPEAALHRAALKLIGSDLTFAQQDSAVAGCWSAVAELSPDLQRLFGLNKGILL